MENSIEDNIGDFNGVSADKQNPIGFFVEMANNANRMTAQYANALIAEREKNARLEEENMLLRQRLEELEKRDTDSIYIPEAINGYCELPEGEDKPSKHELCEVVRNYNKNRKDYLSHRVTPLEPLPIEVASQLPPAKKGGAKAVPDWDYLTKLITSSNKMSELNSKQVLTLLNLLYEKGILDRKFRLQNNLSSNIAYHITESISTHFNVGVKWANMEKVLGRKNLRTLKGRSKSLNDRSLCRQIDEIIDSINTELM